MKSLELLKKLNDDGWYVVTQKGSHRQFKHPLKKGKVTVPIHKGKDIPPGTLKQIYKQAEWK